MPQNRCELRSSRDPPQHRQRATRRCPGSPPLIVQVDLTALQLKPAVNPAIFNGVPEAVLSSELIQLLLLMQPEKFLTASIGAHPRRDTVTVTVPYDSMRTS